jgi:glyoxylase-like metal-dependent hydrolase (beta-lactamase superfamily II)
MGDEGPTIHRHASSPAGALVNAYLVEGEDGVVAVDSTLTVSDSRALRQRLEALGKPLLAVLLTHSHPDHYGGLTELVAGDDVPILAPQGVHDVIRRDDPVKEEILRPMFGDEWPRDRTFPNTVVADGETVEFGELAFTVIDLGPSESPHDSPWLLGDGRTVFLGDQIYDHMHCFLGDGFHREWLANIDRLSARFPADAVLYIGHGGPVDAGAWEWQRGYIETFVAAVQSGDWSDPESAKAGVVEAMHDYLPAEDLSFLMELSVEPVAAQLGLLEPSANPSSSRSSP